MKRFAVLMVAFGLVLGTTAASFADEAGQGVGAKKGAKKRPKKGPKRVIKD